MLSRFANLVAALLLVGLGACINVSNPGAVAAQDKSPEAIIEALYAGYPYKEDPPGGMAIWTDDMQAKWKAELERRRKGQERRPQWDVVSGVIGGGKISDVKVEVDVETDGEAAVRVEFTNEFGARPTKFYGFVRGDSGWKISDQWFTDEQGQFYLSDMLGPQ